jgi:phage terminase large subunit GpA-like protein
VQNLGRAGNPIKLMAARTATFADKKEVFIGSPSNEAEETGIVQLWEDSTRGWLETQCPNAACGAWQVLDIERMDLETAKLACESCKQYFPQWEWLRGESLRALGARASGAWLDDRLSSERIELALAQLED